MIKYDSDTEDLKRMMAAVGGGSDPEEGDECNGASGVP